MSRDWMSDALCAQVSPEMFFPEQGGSTRQPEKVCDSCDVRAQCLQYALENNLRYGVWAGIPAVRRARLHNAYNREHGIQEEKAA